MAATQQDIKRWLEQGNQEGATHVIVVCDTYDHDDYPVYVKPNEDVRLKETQCRAMSMQRVMEVYNLSMNIYEQLAQPRAFNY